MLSFSTIYEALLLQSNGFTQNVEERQTPRQTFELFAKALETYLSHAEIITAKNGTAKKQFCFKQMLLMYANMLLVC